MPVSAPPAFKNPVQQPVDLTGATVGQVIGVTSTGPIKLGLTSGGSGGGGFLPGRIAFTAGAGASNNVNPGGTWPTTVSRLIVNTSATEEWTGLVAGTDGQLVLIWNNAAIGGNLLQLDNLSASSTAANQFSLSGASNIIVPQSGLFVVYDGTLSLWLGV